MVKSDGASDLPRRFYTEVSVEAEQAGFAVRLDRRSPKSPSGKPLVLPTAALAGLCADEWQAQDTHIRMTSMPSTRLAYTVLDKIGSARKETIEEIVRYAGTDALCYRADYPANLNHEQVERWNPVLDWAETALGIRVKTGVGVLHIDQPLDSLSQVRLQVEQLDDFALAGLAHATALLGSAILGLALWHGQMDGPTAFSLSRLEEDFQQRHWGIDEEAAARTALHAIEADLAARWLVGCPRGV
jgi:chaperone required for assembly of F1-ATPase